jgi:multidrug efflux pump subunit AcrA (membrane-fusion protein)
MKASLASARQQNEVLSAQRREAEAKLDQAKAALEGARADLDKTVVKAPIDGAILKVNARLGEYAQAGVLSNPLMTMGSIDPLHVRVDIDEADSWRVHKDSPSVASLRGNPAISVALSFVRFEPYVLPKRSLSGDTAERVDTRVLQAIYAFARATSRPLWASRSTCSSRRQSGQKRRTTRPQAVSSSARSPAPRRARSAEQTDAGIWRKRKIAIGLSFGPAVFF